MGERLHNLRNTILRLFDFTWQLVSGNLTSDGIQYSTETDTTTANTNVVIFSKYIDPYILADILTIEFALTAAFRSVTSATADLIWKWQASDDNSNWVDLHSAVTETNIGTTYTERSMGGYFTPETNFNQVPFYIRLILQCNEANEGRAKVKNGSYVRFIAKV